MTAAENKRIIQRVFDAAANADTQPFVDAMAEDVVWIVTGRSKWSRRFEGKEALVNDLVRPLFSRFATPYRNIAERIIADDEGNVVVLAKGEVRTKAGKDYNNDYCFVLRMKDGKIVEVREYMDSALAESVLGEPG